jgi:hypothetical protein
MSSSVDPTQGGVSLRFAENPFHADRIPLLAHSLYLTAAIRSAGSRILYT